MSQSKPKKAAKFTLNSLLSKNYYPITTNYFCDHCHKKINDVKIALHTGLNTDLCHGCFDMISTNVHKLKQNSQDIPAITFNYDILHCSICDVKVSGSGKISDFRPFNGICVCNDCVNDNKTTECKKCSAILTSDKIAFCEPDTHDCFCVNCVLDGASDEEPEVKEDTKEIVSATATALASTSTVSATSSTSTISTTSSTASSSCSSSSTHNEQYSYGDDGLYYSIESLRRCTEERARTSASDSVTVMK